MLRTFSWLLVPGMVLALAPAALADVVVTRAGEHVYGTILTETPVGVSVLVPGGLMRGFHVDEVAEVRRDPATRTAAGIAAHLEREARIQQAEWRRLEGIQQQRESFFHLGHQLTVGAAGNSASTLLPGAFAKYRLLVGPFLAAYAGVGYGMGLSPLNKEEFDPDTGDVLAVRKVSPTALDVPFGVELRYAGLFLGGGATYLMGTNLPTKEYGVVQSIGSVLPQVVFGYGYQFKQGPVAVGPVVGVDLRYTPATSKLPTGYYGGGLFWGWTF